jgi:molecular chaperone HtpG
MGIIGHFDRFYSALVAEKLKLSLNHLKTSQLRWTCDGSPEFTLVLAIKQEEQRIILHIAEDSLDFLEEYKIRELTNTQVHADSN